MRRLSRHPRMAAQVRTAWQAQLAAAGRTPGLRATLLRQRHDLLPRFATYYTQLQALPRRLRRQLQRRCQQSLAGVALLLSLGQAPALAAIINVTTNIPDISADGQCSLIEAIVNANDNAPTHADCDPGSNADTIVLQSGSVHTLTAVDNATYGETGLPVITSSITIAGQGSTIERDSSTPTFRLFAVGTGGHLTLEETRVSGGVATGSFLARRGGGVYNRAALTITNSTIAGNSASLLGGGVYTTGGGNMTLTNSTIAGNSAHYGGGGVFTASRTVTITNSTIEGNSAGNGGGIYTRSGSRGTLTITNSTVAGNSASSSGGGVFTDSGTVMLINSTIAGNSAEFGGGVGDLSSILTITNSTIAGNSALGGGGVYTNSGSVTLIHSTIAGNSASSGGGVYTFLGSVMLTRTLVSGNRASNGDEIYTAATGPVTADNANLFGHRGLTNAQAFVGFTPGLSDITATSDGTQPTALSAILSPLANNGAPTETHALPPGSPAIDAAGSDCPATDQRDVFRPQGMACDIGAFEAEAATTACLVYGVQDTGERDSQLFTLDPEIPAVTLLGPMLPGYDLEALALHPTTHTLYAAASDANQVGSRGMLFTVDATTGALTPVGPTGFKGIEDLAFHPTTGVLWGWAKGKGLVTIDLATGAATRVFRSSKRVEGVAWALDGSRLYAAAGRTLLVYDPVTNKLRTLARNLPGETEALAMRPDGLLAVGVHGARTLYAYDVTLKQMVPEEAIATPEMDDIEGLAWPTTCGLDR